MLRLQRAHCLLLPQIGNGADGISDIEGKVARVATSKLGNERVSITNPAPNPGIISGTSLHCGLLAMELMGSADAAPGLNVNERSMIR